MTKPKNVLFIAVDDLRPEISCFGKAKLHTPNLYKIAAAAFNSTAPTARCQSVVLRE